MTVFEDKNDISLNIYFYDEHGGNDDLVLPGRMSEKRAQQHVNLLLIANNEWLYHWVWITNISCLLSGRKVMALLSLLFEIVRSEKALRNHLTFCKDHYRQRVEYPNPDEELLEFEGHKKQYLLAFIIYADFECELV